MAAITWKGGERAHEYNGFAVNGDYSVVVVEMRPLWALIWALLWALIRVLLFPESVIFLYHRINPGAQAAE